MKKQEFLKNPTENAKRMMYKSRDCVTVRSHPAPEPEPDIETRTLWAFSECVGCSPADLLRARALINS